MATAAATTSVCQVCRRLGATAHVVFRQNIGAIVLRFTRKVEGRLCRACVESTLADMTLLTLVAGWWGFVSFFATPLIVVSNVLQYRGATRREPLCDVPSTGRGRNAIVAMAAMLSLAGLAVAGIIGGLVFLARSAPSAGQDGSSPGAEERRRAETKVLADDGQPGHGNTAEAKRYAAAYSEKLALARRLAFTGGRGEGSPSLTSGRFLTHCEVREGKVCFVVHVPELRNYEPGAQDALAKLAWVLAQETVGPRSDAGALRLAVGLRGVLLYGVVMTGTAAGPPHVTGDDPRLLDAFFTGPAPAADPVKSARATEPPPAPTPEPEPTTRS